MIYHNMLTLCFDIENVLIRKINIFDDEEFQHLKETINSDEEQYIVLPESINTDSQEE
jgi:hypothetical protein